MNNPRDGLRKLLQEQLTQTQVVEATYANTGVSRYSGNPFIEALGSIGETKFDHFLSNYPEPPSAKDRIKSDNVRLLELPMLGDIVHPFMEYAEIGSTLNELMREPYLARNPVNPMYQARLRSLHEGRPMPNGWQSSAKGGILTSISGMGKTTLYKRYLAGRPQIIHHTSYHGAPMNRHQISYIVIRIPHDGTLRGLCMHFFEEVDRLTDFQFNYAKIAKSTRSVAGMVDLMNQIATAYAIGFIIVDEVQNLRGAKMGTAEHTLNLFSEVVELLGIGLLIVGTPAVEKVFAKSLRNIRKLATLEHRIPHMAVDGSAWATFCEVYWGYQWTKKKVRLTKEILKAWHLASAGNTAFATIAYSLAQKNAIGGDEVVDSDSFDRVTLRQMGFLRPAINALLSGRQQDLERFEDLMYPGKLSAISDQYAELAKAANARLHPVGSNDSDDQEEFEEVEEAAAEKKATAKNKPAKVGPRVAVNIELPMEDPPL